MKSHRLQREDGFAGLVHRFNLFLEPTRRTYRAELTGRVDQNWYGIVVPGCGAANIADITTVAHVCTGDGCTDANNVLGRGNVTTSTNTQCDVGATGGVGLERALANSSIEVAGCIVKKCARTIGRVAVACGIVRKRAKTCGRVVETLGISGKRASTDGRVFDPGRVVEKRYVTTGCVAGAGV